MPVINPPPYEMDVDAFGEGARELIANFKRLGLMWEMKLGFTGGDFYNDNITNVPVQVDGDGIEHTPAVSLIGNTLPFERVVILCVPPNLRYIIGRLKIYDSQSAWYTRTSVQAVTTGTDTKINFTSSQYTMPTYIRQNSGVDFEVLITGQYGIASTARWAGRAAGQERYLAIADSNAPGTQRYCENSEIKMTHPGEISQNVATQRWFQEGDMFSVYVFHDGGAPALNLVTAWGNPNLAIAYLDLR